MMFRYAVLCFLAQSSLGAVTLEEATRAIAERAMARFGPELPADKLAITVKDRKTGAVANFRGDVPIYPASVVKLFYLVAAHERMEAGKLADTPELRRAMRDMIVDSSNDATGLVLDSITGTTSGPELDGPGLEAWMEKRNAVNRYFAGLGYSGINVNQKTFAEGPYGRERQGRGPKLENGNRLTTAAVARLLDEIVSKKSVTAARCEQMLELLHRDPTSPATDPDDQAHGFSGPALPKGSGYWSKAGWTSTTRHDATYVELPNGARYVAVIFTVDNAKRAGIIPFIAGEIAQYFLAAP